MGAFALCIENATRDIHSLLTLHRVHPQVHADIQRILGSLLRKQYTDMTVLHSPALTDSPEQVCHAIVENIIEKTVNCAIPAADIAALEKRCLQLAEEKDALEAEVIEAENELAEAQTLLRSLKDAHDYTLHRYFREVLSLRNRIHDLKRQNRAYRAHALGPLPVPRVSGSTAFSTSMGSQLQQFMLNENPSIVNISPRKGGAAGERLGADEVLMSEAAAASDTSVPSTSSMAVTREGKTDKADGNSDDSSSARRLSETCRGIANDEAAGDARGLAAPTPTAASGMEGNALTRAASSGLRGKERSVRIAPFVSYGSSRGPLMMLQGAAKGEMVPLPEPESVDAIFDYEEYIRILNGGQGPWSKRFEDAMREADGEDGTGRRRHRRSPRARTCTFADADQRDSDTMYDDEALASQLEQEQAKAKGFQWLLHLALEPIKHGFHVELEKVRQAVYAMQKEHTHDVQVISRALAHLQSRNDGLLDFLETFVQETKRTITVLSRDSHARTITDLLSSGTLPGESAETITTFFSLNAAPALGVWSTASSPNPPTPLTLSTDRIGHDAGEESTIRSDALRSRKEWRLKPDARLNAERQAVAMRAMNQRLRRPDVLSATVVTADAPDAASAANYYRADLGLPYWNAHPITTHAQEVFSELQVMAKDMRVTRVQQLYAYEEAMSAQLDAEGRRVRFNKRSGSVVSSEGSRRRHGSSAMPQETPDSFYAADPWPRRRLQDGWRTKTVVNGDEATAADLLLELVHLRMRRACDQVRLARAQATITQASAPNPVEHKETSAARTKRGTQILTGAKLKASEAPSMDFASPEEVLKHRALQQLSTGTKKRIDRTSQRIAELQRLLDIFFAENEVKDAEQLSAAETARRLAEEKASGLYWVNGELKSAAQLWKSPYLNDGNVPSGVAYLPIGLNSTVDAAGNVSGGAGACVLFGDTSISVAPYTNTASYVPRRGDTARKETEGETGFTEEGGDGNRTDKGAVQDTPGSCNAPYVAVMDYCRGVQLGRPVGRHGGPVYLFQDASTGEYYVGDAEGRPAIQKGTEKGKEDAAAESVETSSPAGSPMDADGQRSSLAMTRILFPAPLRYVSPTTPAAAPSRDEDAEKAASMTKAPPASSSVLTKPTTASPSARGLQPLYLVPMAIPLSGEDAAIREGWQACHRHGHTRQDPIFYTTLSPLPLSSSYHHVVPQMQDGLGEAAAAAAPTAAMAGSGEAGDRTYISGNKYLVQPPRVFQPADEAAPMVRVRAVRLQSRNAVDNGPRTDVMPESSNYATDLTPANSGDPHRAPMPRCATNAGPASVLSDNPNPGVTPSPADTAVTVPTVATSTPPALVVQPSLLPGNKQPSSPRPLDPLHVSLSESVTTAAATVAGPDSCPPLSASTPPPSAVPCGYSAAAPFASSTLVPPSSSCMTAAVLLAKQQRMARLAKEEAEAIQMKAERQEAWQQRQQQQQRSATYAPTLKETFFRLPHLTPLPSHVTETASMLPPAASSARLQRQMRAEKYSLAPPPSLSRRTESTKQSLSEWDLKDDV
ncbi:hypothetical protein ABB37_04452 [Leptomonas pyrrhocoris]|uniref:Uncharacterized protein n=1 Tax=Leptomonas pyrrhocoris TaxID=157538 RepID=A0A0M9G2L7_LEPPY|nr:hypothetical protein ABB37_04452 [Leptomonas pyrrhocoris]XP_015659534.1 hypothetical protein ABB37_04452 [Leptomonas pyrrhocoris]KPA81094.1 hypothetical protein ABB37_04452 [Leptomonas pyrrhocoris]KPA81095.1 hypothetical protein ABB37_04452 [Leptomonas pyrrhocoris]|eukprot:XP_015659533.1 hypothetical protein ABB37_04452 [Leptomonas pyrrhocoris]